MADGTCSAIAPPGAALLSKTISKVLASVVTAGTAWMKPYRRTITRALVSERLAPTITMETPAGGLHFFTPTARALHDPWALYEGEPETIRWLDGLPQDHVLWDIGANIGVYALYAAKCRGMRVLAFEPSAASYAVLVRNMEINHLDERISAYCLAFDTSTRLDYLYMANTGAGHSMHAFGQATSVEGAIKTTFRQSVLGFSIDAFCDLFRPPPPDHIKLDVDSIEIEILRGAERTLTGSVRTILVEIDESAGPTRSADIERILTSAGFTRDQAFAQREARRNVLFRNTRWG